MSICLCYHDEQNFLHERGVCYGTKEKEPCSCGGNPVKCDFYEEVREKYIHRTNADRIRSMNDEELAWELARICRMPFYKDDSEIDGYEVDCWAKWLKQEGE